MIIIGLTGGTGSGKSTVAQILNKYGAIIIDADTIAREVVEKGSQALKEIKMTFGSEVIESDGSLDRKKLGSIVFSDSTKLQKLNQITHKYIINKIENRIEHFKVNNNDSIIVIDAALLTELSLNQICDYVWVVYAEEATRIERIKQREGISYEDIKNRINSQSKHEEITVYSDFVIENNGILEDLEHKIKNMLKNIEGR